MGDNKIKTMYVVEDIQDGLMIHVVLDQELAKIE